MQMSPEMKEHWKKEVERSIKSLDMDIDDWEDKFKTAEECLRKSKKNLHLFKEELYRLNKEGD